YFASRHDPHRLARDWEALLEQRAHFLGLGLLGGLLVFAVAVAGLFVALAVAARAGRLHPTSATLGGLFLAAAMMSLAAMGVWTSVVATYAALEFQWLRDAVARQALLIEAQFSEHLLLLGLWCTLAFAALGLYCLGRAVRGERGWLPVALKLAAAFILLHLPVKLYLARESLLFARYVRWLAVTDQLLVWGALALACYFAAAWLRRIGRALPE
ncbi:MAG: hypothetical protein HYY26_01040, partial [Acidobacteria bacterium]|nr:hypothetical protein [Acidobacteriota bacterium]